jgi:ABC-type sugar transport system ATPase subunit
VLSKCAAFNLGLVDLRSVVFSPLIPLLSRRQRKEKAERAIRDLYVKTPDIEVVVARLSRGNQLKAVHRALVEIRPESPAPR